MDDNFKSFDGNNTENLFIHELFLVFRFLSLGLALLQLVSFYFYIKLYFKDGPCMCGAKFDDVRSLSEAVDS